MGDAESLECQLLVREGLVSGNAGVKGIHVASMLGEEEGKERIFDLNWKDFFSWF